MPLRLSIPCSSRLSVASMLLVLLRLICSAESANANDRQAPPNVIVIITDDQGYADVGFHGCQDIPTPNLDALASGGVICTDGYVTCPVCAPSRAGLLTGRYQQRSGFEDNAWNRNAGLNTEVRTVADDLKSAGYATIAIGKWHLGQLPQFRPLVRGFTEHYGFLGGGRSFLPLKESQGVAFVPKDPDQVDLWRNEERGDDPPYVTDAFGDAAVAAIERHKDRHFFLYVAFNAPHVPLQAIEKYLQRFPKLTGARRTYAAMLSAVDDAVGRISEKLRTEGLEEHTLVFFLSDNGGHPLANAARNTPLREQKSTVYEGGIRVPFVVKWTNHLPAGTKYSQQVVSLDIAATALAVAGVEPSKSAPLDGVNLVPHLRGDDASPPHETLYWRFIEHRAIRHGDWKLTMPADQPEGLYDLSQDISESNDQSAQHPEILADLKARFAAWNAELPPSKPRAAAKPKAAAPAVLDILPDQARKHVGQSVRATLLVRKTKKSEQTKRTYLDSELDYKDPKNLGILIEDAELPNFAKAGIAEPHVHYKDQTIRVIGKPFLEDDTVFIKVERPDQIEVLEPADKR